MGPVTPRCRGKSLDCGLAWCLKQVRGDVPSIGADEDSTNFHLLNINKQISVRCTVQNAALGGEIGSLSLAGTWQIP